MNAKGAEKFNELMQELGQFKTIAGKRKKTSSEENKLQKRNDQDILIQNIFTECTRNEKKVISQYKIANGLIPFQQETEDMISVHFDLIFSGDEDFQAEVADSIRKALMDQFSGESFEIKMVVDMAVVSFINWMKIQAKLQEIIDGPMDMDRMELYERLEKLTTNFSEKVYRAFETLRLMTGPVKNVNIRKAEQVNVAEKMAVQVNKSDKEEE